MQRCRVERRCKLYAKHHRPTSHGIRHWERAAESDEHGRAEQHAPAIRTEHPPGVCVRHIVRRLTPTECARLQGFPDRWGHPEHKGSFTEEELAFWQGVRDVYAEINGKQVKAYTANQMLKWYNGLHTDSTEYKMWGNGIALPCALFVMDGIAEMMGGKDRG